MLVTFSLTINGCKKESIEILTLGKAGSEFYFGERVAVWAGTQGNKRDISYEWKASGGSFEGWRTQNLFENLWIAPAVAGDYTITATAKNGSNSTSRTTNMKVSRYFFDHFQSKFTFNGNGWLQSNTTQLLVNSGDINTSMVELTASSTSAPNMRRLLDLADLKIPFSIRTKLGWKGNFRAALPITISLYFKQPEANKNYPYIREIRWEIFPTNNPASTNNYQLRYETFVPATNTSRFSVNTNTTATLPLPLPLINPVTGRNPVFMSVNGEEKNYSFSIDAENVFHAYVDGVLWFTSNGIKDWLIYAKATYPGFEDPVGREYRIAFPARASASAVASKIFISNVYINNDGEILK